MNEGVLGSQGRFVLPETLVSHFHIRTGEKVADFGAGRGFFIPLLSQHVGEEGIVYALEIQRNLTEAITDVVREKNLGNVEVLWCDIEKLGGTKLEDNLLDTAIMVNTLFQFQEKATAIAEIKRTLRPGGKFFLVDWSESFGGLGPQPENVIGMNEARSLCEAAGLVFDRNFDAADHHYGLAMRKP